MGTAFAPDAGHPGERPTCVSGRLRQPPPQGLPHGLEVAVQVDFKLAGHEDVVPEDEDVIYV